MERETRFELATLSLEGRYVQALWHRIQRPERIVSSHVVVRRAFLGAQRSSITVRSEGVSLMRAT
jgi:hypothetical protein